MIQPILQCNDGLANSFSGKLINYNQPTADMFCLTDIATGLANVCRFAGQIHSHYSVAQHTMLVWYLAPDRLKKAALLHDAAEAYLGDVIKPFKVLLGDAYAKYEKSFEEVIFAKYGVDIALLEEIKPIDTQALILENDYLRFNRFDLMGYLLNITEENPHRKPKYQLLYLLEEAFGKETN